VAVKRGDVVLIVAAGDLGKPRPAVVVQADELGDQTTSVIICPMSSELGAAQTLRPIVGPSAATGLRLASQIMTDKIIALRRQHIRRVIGHLDAKARDALDRALLIVLGLADRK
jgi:mRNA interferase MazF